MIDVDIKLKDIFALEAFKDVKDHIVGGGADYFCGETGELTLRELQCKKQPTWDARDMAYGLNRLNEIAASRREYVFSPYSEEEMLRDGDKKRTGIVWFPGDGNSRSGAFGTHFFVSPKDDLEAVFVTNRTDLGGSGSYISRKVEELIFQNFAEESRS